MTGIFQSINSGQRKTLAWMFAAVGAYWLALIYQLGAQWSVYEQYSYGWAVPFLCAVLVWQRIQKSEVGGRRTEDGKQNAESRKQKLISNFCFPSFCFLLLLGSALLYAPTRFLHEANPIWRLTSLLWAIEVIVITLVVLRFAFQTAHFELRTSHFVFPVCFFLVAVPWPSGIEAFLVQTLTRLNVSATVEMLGWFGIPALQHGNVIEVATGDVGINEACSGIRSFQATLMISLFFGEFYRLNVARRAVCVLAGFALSFLFNMARTTLLTWVAAKEGVASVAKWHDPAGVTVLVGCFVTLWLVAVWLGGKSRKQESAVRSPISDFLSSNHPLSSARWLAIALLAWFVLVEAGTQSWFRMHEGSAASRVEWSMDAEGTNSRLTKVEIPADIRAQFRADENVEAQWRDDTGNAWQLYYFRWFPTHSLNKRVAIQLAKTHGPEICLPAVGMTLKSDLGVITVPVGDTQFTFRQFLFLAGDRPLHVFYAIYEDPSGSTILANRRQDTASRIAAALAGSRNYGQRYVEMAVAGLESPEEAKAVFARQLNKMVKIDKP